PALLDGTAPRIPNELSKGGYFGGRKPEDGRIDWTKPAQEVYNLHRAVAPPYPGAFTDIGGRRYVIERARLAKQSLPSLPPGLAVLDNVIFGVCGDGRALAITSLLCDDTPVAPAELSARLAATSNQ
ncbi:MAG TPA: formyltransferase, partial [Telluria sp.]|nr:formyltransferase [Telluria sp.]